MKFRTIHYFGLFALLVITIVLLFFLLRPSPRLLFLITLDTTRADAINYAMQDNNETPNLAKLAHEGVRFERAFSLIPITLPSHAAMFYGQPPNQLKVYTNQQTCDVPHLSLAEILRSKGYQTAAAISLGVLQRAVGIGRGFDHYLESFRPGVWIKHAEEVNHDLMQLMEKHPPKKKSFYWVHYSDPHNPYYTPAYRGGEFTAHLHDRKIFSCDAVDHVRVQLNLELKPGKNTLFLRARMPKKITSNKKVMVISIQFLDFSPTPDSLPNGIEMILPKRWQTINRRQASSRPRIGFNTWSRRSRLVFYNRREEKVTLRLSFIYRTFEPDFSSRYLYYEEIRYMDQQIGELVSYLKRKGWYNRATFIIMGDHGEGLGEHRNLVGHIHYLNALYSHVPLIITGSGIEDRGVRREIASNLNIAPTLLALAGVKKPAYMKGDSLLRPFPSHPLLLETYSPEAYHDGFALLEYPYQLIHYPKRDEQSLEFYNLKSDRLGINVRDPSVEEKRIYADLRNQLVDLARALLSLKSSGGEISSKHKEILKTLGYL